VQQRKFENMKYNFGFLVAISILCLGLTGSVPTLAHAEKSSGSSSGSSGGSATLPVTFNLVPGAQVAKTESTVVGIRVSGVYGENKNMIGLDVGILGNVTSDTFGGAAVAGLFNKTGKMAVVTLFQVAGLTNINSGKAYIYGFEFAGLVNTVGDEGSIWGAQIAGLTNYAPKTDVHGLQLGLVNRARKVHGFQIGAVNIADSLSGIQLGLLNINHHGIPFMPVINIGF
jgi:hypothetical protein